jgi:hypothetical protein
LGRSAFSLLARSWRDVSAPLIPARPRRSRRIAADLYVVPGPWPRLGRPVKHDVATWRVIDDWPAYVPVMDDEIDVFEAWFGDFFRRTVRAVSMT